MTARFQRTTAAVMLIGLVGISGLLLRNAYFSESSPQSAAGLADHSTPAEPLPSWIGTVTGVVDGDTIEVVQNGQTRRVRIYGIDCPETGQAFAEEARELTGSLVAEREVRVAPIEIDRLGRMVADVTFSDGDGVRHLNHELLEAGVAWWYQEERPQTHDLESLEAQAREARRGLWADPDSIPPWDYRELTRREGAADTSGDGAPTAPH